LWGGVGWSWVDGWHTIVVSPASFAASIRPSVTVLRQSTHVPKTSKKSALSGIVAVTGMVMIFEGELENFDGFLG
jgi:hypothetical protein